MTIFAVWQGGLVMYGGMFGAIVAGTWCARREKVRVLHAFDLGMVAASSAGDRPRRLPAGRRRLRRVVPEKYAHLPFPITLRVPIRCRGQPLRLENAGRCCGRRSRG
jgi:hypothetical protein